MIANLWHYKGADGRHDPNADVTCIILTDVFYFEDADCLDISDRWSNSIVAGKMFRGQEASELVREVQLRLAGVGTLSPGEGAVPAARPGVEIVSARRRLGQDAFRTLVADAYLTTGGASPWSRSEGACAPRGSTSTGTTRPCFWGEGLRHGFYVKQQRKQCGRQDR